MKKKSHFFYLCVFLMLGQVDIALALDADNDNISDFIEAGGSISGGEQVLTQLDSDGDGLDDLFDVGITGGQDSNEDGIDDIFVLLDSDKDGIFDLIDIDSDNDKIPDVIETNNDADFDGIANYLDRDSNNDGQLDILESGVLNIDIDNDDIDDFFDADLDGVEGPDEGRFDVNGDGIQDEFFTDANNNNQIDYQELDFDQDGIPAPLESGASGNDIDNDGIDDTFDADDDGIAGADSVNSDINDDGILDKVIKTLDFDNDGLLNSVDSDSDGDGISDFIEAGSSGADYDQDGIDDIFDANSDGDDVADLGKVDHNSDGIHDLYMGTNTDKNNIISDSQPDYLDRDSDNDGISDFIESHARGKDFDSDGIDDNFDADADGGGSIDVGKLDANHDGVDDQVTLDYDESGIDDYLEKAMMDEGNKLAFKDSDQDGIPDRIEQNASGNDRDLDGIDDAFDADQDGIEGTDIGKIDDDNDGMDDHEVAGGLRLDTDNDGLPNYLDLDSDSDGISDLIEANVSGEDFDSDGIDDTFDANSDNDSAIDFGKVDENNDGIDDGIGTDSDGDGIADYIDRDSDNDGLPDAIEGIVAGIPVDSDSDGIPNYLDIDSDNDGLSDTDELLTAIQLAISNSTLDLAEQFSGSIESIINTDTDNDGIRDLFDADIDGGGGIDRNKMDRNHDGINDVILSKLGVMLTTSADSSSGFDTPVQTSALDSDKNGIADYLELPSSARTANGDADNDGIQNRIECLTSEAAKLSSNNIFTPIGCLDSDGDGIIDLLDVDSDNDGLLDRLEKGSSAIANNFPWDTDGDGIFNFRDIDSDGDSLIDEAEIVDVDGDGRLDDDDNDGIPNVVDADNNGIDRNDNDLVPDQLECPVYPNCPDSDSDGQPDYSDDDSDNDGIPDRLELYALLDSNNNGIADWYEGEDGAIQLPDFDNDGLANHQDLDSDNDGINDTQESAALGMDSDGDGIDDTYDVDFTFGEDVNNDGFDDAKLVYVQEALVEIEQVMINADDRDGDGIPDYLDLGIDSDNDGKTDTEECKSFPECLRQDEDGDGFANFIDSEIDQEIDNETDGIGSISTVFALLILLVSFSYRKKSNCNMLSRQYLALMLSLFSVNSQAIEPYIGSGISYGKHGLNVNDSSVELSDQYNVGKTIYVGLSGEGPFRYEIAYSDFGSNTLTSTLTSQSFLDASDEVIDKETNIKTQMIDASVYYEITNKWLNPYIKLGIANLLRESSSDDFDLNSQSELKPLYGLGVYIDINDNWKVRNQIDFINGEDNYWIGLSLEYRFIAEKSKAVVYRNDFSSAFKLVSVEKSIIKANEDDVVIGNVVVGKKSCGDLSEYLQIITFKPRGATLEGYAKARLLDFSRVITKPEYKNVRFELNGYFAEVNKPSYSLKVSQQRAEVVSQYLIERGVAESSLISKGHGGVEDSVLASGVEIRCVGS